MLEAIRMRRIEIVWVYLSLSILMLGLLCASIMMGTVNIGLLAIVNALLQLVGFDVAGSEQSTLIINQIRLPRALLAMLVGALLGLCGTASQGLFRNPLADPSLIGVTSGASLGASVVIVLCGTSFSPLLGLSLVSLGAFIGGIAAVCLVYSISANSTDTSVANILLAGIAITYLVSSASNLFAFYADNDMLRRISLWHMGGLDGANYQFVVCAALALAFLSILLPRYSAALNILLLGESEARYLGVEVAQMKRSILVLIAVGMGIAVAVGGVIGFVGLVVPHVMRMIIGPDHRHLLPLTALAGACLLLLADLLARSVVSPSELPVGVITSFIGAPLFITLLCRRHQHGMRSQ